MLSVWETYLSSHAKRTVSIIIFKGDDKGLTGAQPELVPLFGEANTIYQIVRSKLSHKILTGNLAQKADPQSLNLT